MLLLFFTHPQSLSAEMRLLNEFIANNDLDRAMPLLDEIVIKLSEETKAK